MTDRRIHIIACGVLAADLRAAAHRLGVQASMQLLPGGLHRTPNALRRRLQEAIDVASAEHRGDLIVLGYGVCGRGTVGLRARNIPLVLPRVHDCIALFLGSDAAYQQQFARYPGTYYISAGWVDENTQPESAGGQGDSEAEQLVGEGSVRCGSTEFDFGALIAKHGRENAEAIRHFLSSWQRNYQRAAYIDTGVGGHRRKYADIARAMAEEFGWEYEELRGTHDLLTSLLTARRTTDEVLIVPPHHVTSYDAVGKGLAAVPVWQADRPRIGRKHTLVFEETDRPDAADAPHVRLGLGIDAGGTYTDVVLYDFPSRKTVCLGDRTQKGKALTTRHDYTIGIERALDQLDTDALRQVDLVSLSTTLATNAIVEGRGQKVGLLVMPPYGVFRPGDFGHQPIAVLRGQLEIDGTEREPIDPDEIRRVVREIIDAHEVGALAVAGFAAHNNPSHELRVKSIIQEQTGLSVTCGHEVSQTLDYRVRATTAALNAQIIPYLEALIEKVGVALGHRGIHAPVMVVRSDGSLMSVDVARQRPIETMLSGPAASVAGASFLTGERDALVVDIGGTTTDTAAIRDGIVRTCEQGASVGGWRTHVKALDMRTLGLGGDSLIAWEKRSLRIGPRRVAPVCWLMDGQRKTASALDWIERHLDRFEGSTRGMEFVSLNGAEPEIPLSDDERRIVEILSGRPHSLDELSDRTGAIAWRFLPLDRLERADVVQRCGLTPTDMLHVTDRLDLWNADAAQRICELFGHLVGTDPMEFAERVLRRVVRTLAVELLKKQLDEQAEADGLDASPAAMTMIENWLDGGGEGLRVRLQLARPVVGIGAPAALFVPQAAELLETRAVVPDHADVANAIGAITSSVRVHRQVRITPNEFGSYSLYGLTDTPTFVDFHEAHDFAVAELQRRVRDLARRAGTSETRVEVRVDDRIAPLSDGGQIFVGRTLDATLAGRPDLAG